MNGTSGPECVLQARAELGEGPVWRGGALWFVDIKGQRIHRLDPARIFPHPDLLLEDVGDHADTVANREHRRDRNVAHIAARIGQARGADSQLAAFHPIAGIIHLDDRVADKVDRLRPPASIQQDVEMRVRADDQHQIDVVECIDRASVDREDAIARLDPRSLGR